MRVSKEQARPVGGKAMCSLCSIAKARADLFCLRFCATKVRMAVFVFSAPIIDAKLNLLFKIDVLETGVMDFVGCEFINVCHLDFLKKTHLRFAVG